MSDDQNSFVILSPDSVSLDKETLEDLCVCFAGEFGLSLVVEEGCYILSEIKPEFRRAIQAEIVGQVNYLSGQEHFYESLRNGSTDVFLSQRWLSVDVDVYRARFEPSEDVRRLDIDPDECTIRAKIYFDNVGSRWMRLTGFEGVTKQLELFLEFYRIGHENPGFRFHIGFDYNLINEGNRRDLNVIESIVYDPEGLSRETYKRVMMPQVQKATNNSNWGYK